MIFKLQLVFLERSLNNRSPDWTQGQEEFRVNKWITYLRSHLQNVYTCRLARLISPMGSLWIYCKRFLRFLSDPDRLCCSPFWKSITASHILAGARHVARRVTEGRRPKGDRGTNCRVKKWTREETCTRGHRSLWTASLGDGSEWDRKRKGNRPLLFENQNISCGGSFKDLRDLCEGNRVLIEVKIFQDWTFVVHVDSLQYLKQVSLVQRLPSSRKTHSQRHKR